MPEPDAADHLVDPEIARAETLPASAFTDPAFLRREMATVFDASWLIVPDRDVDALADDPRSLQDLVRRRGARAPISLLHRPLFLQRDWQGVLRMFPNVCTHAWHTLVQGPDRDRSVTCPQHGRKFDTEGRYVSQPGFEDVDDVPRACDHLRQLPVAEWGPLLFACPGAPAAPFNDVIAPVRESLGKLPFDSLERRPARGEVRDLAGNWKQHAWNYMDALHIPYIHSRPGGLSEAIDLATYTTELHGHGALQWAYARNPDHGFDPDLLPERFRDSAGRRVFALWWFLFPNMTLNFYPWGLSVNAYMPDPVDPQRTRFVWHRYSWDGAKFDARDDIWMLDVVDDEDVDALTQVARGVRSGYAPRGRFAPGAEAGPHWFHRRVYTSVFEDGASSAASPASAPRRAADTRNHS